MTIPAISGKPSICPRLCLLEYLKRTEELRKDTKQLFVSFCKPHAAVSSATIARWIKGVLAKSGIDVSVYKAHSTRSAVTSKALFLGASVEAILKLADWSNERTFSKFYKRIPANESIGQMLLNKV